MNSNNKSIFVSITLTRIYYIAYLFLRKPMNIKIKMKLTKFHFLVIMRSLLRKKKLRETYVLF